MSLKTVFCAFQSAKFPGGRAAVAAKRPQGRVFPHHDELTGMSVRQRPQQNGVDDREDRARCPDAECKRERRDGGESRIRPKHSRAKPEVLPKLVEPAGP